MRALLLIFAVRMEIVYDGFAYVVNLLILHGM